MFLSRGLILTVEGLCPAQFSSNFPQHTSLEASSNPEDLDLLVQVFD